MSELTQRIEDAIKHQFEGEATGHDWYHIQRVLNTSRYIHESEGGNLEVIELAALLHDISDYKFNGGNPDQGGITAYNLLKEHDCPEEIAVQVRYIVDNISYKGANTPEEMNSLEGRIVQDADRLDAIGAIGIGRTFAYGGYKNQPMYDPQVAATLHDSFEDYANDNSSTINHFYEKLLLLADRLNTDTAKEIGKERHTLMENFLDAFYKEWNFGSEL